MTVEDFAFHPERLVVRPGDTVRWVNRDAADHSIADPDPTRSSEALSTGEDFTATYDEPGMYPYVCGIHQYMKGEVVVER